MNNLPPAKKLDMNVSQQFVLSPETQPASILTDVVEKRIIDTIGMYDSKKELQTFKNPDYAKEALAIAPMWLYQQASQEAIKDFRDITTYDYKNKTIVIKIHDYDGKLISYKRRRLNDIKWASAKDTHPNRQCLINNSAISDKDGNFLRHIYVVEGHHDYLTAILLGIDVLMIPTVNYRLFTDYEMSILKNRDVIFIPDWEEDKMSGVDTMSVLAQQASDVARNAKVFSLPLFLEKQSITFESKKLDLSEVVELWDNELGSFVNILEYVADEGIFYIGEIF